MELAQRSLNWIGWLFNSSQTDLIQFQMKWNETPVVVFFYFWNIQIFVDQFEFMITIVITVKFGVNGMQRSPPNEMK